MVPVLSTRVSLHLQIVLSNYLCQWLSPSRDSQLFHFFLKDDSDVNDKHLKAFELTGILLLGASQDFLIYLCPWQCAFPIPTELNLHCITRKLGRRNFLKIDSYELTVNHKSIVLVKLSLKLEFGSIWYGGKVTEPRQEGIYRV